MSEVRPNRVLHPGADLPPEKREELNLAIARSGLFVHSVSPKHRNKALSKVVLTEETQLLTEMFDGGIISKGLISVEEDVNYPDTNITALAILLKYGNSAPEQIKTFSDNHGITNEQVESVFTELDSLVERAVPIYNSTAIFAAVGTVDNRTVDISLEEERKIHRIARELEPLARFGGKVITLDAVE